MKKIEIYLNDFLFNSGVLGLHKILEYKKKESYIQKEGNVINIDVEAFEDFEQDYIDTMIYFYEEDTKYHTITKLKGDIDQLDLNIAENEKILKDKYKFIKTSMESASYKAGYEIVKLTDDSENPYEYIEILKNEKELERMKELSINIIEHIEKNKEIYCMKDIIYTKINCFWENVSFLNRTSNKKDIKEEYVRTFVKPFKEYIQNERKPGNTCIECGNSISKKEASGMSWLKDVGVDMSRKKSIFWNFNEDMFICPICNLIYSCIPLGFTMIGSNGIFVNNNENFEMLIGFNRLIETNNNLEEQNYEKIYQKILSNYINRIEQVGNKEKIKYELRNIQVIKRIGPKDKMKYEFNMISKDKLKIIEKVMENLGSLSKTRAYQDVLGNLLNGNKQYKLINEYLRKKENMKNIKDILIIELNSMGGVNVKERKERIQEMFDEGESLQIHFFKNNENENKLKSYAYKLQNALNANNLEDFMKLLTLFYGSLGKPIPNCEAMKVLIKEPEYFRLLGYSYVYGLGKWREKREEKVGGK